MLNRFIENVCIKKHIKDQPMKKIYLFIMICFLAAVMASCKEEKFLDETEITDLSEETVFADSSYTTSFLFDIYRDIGFSSSPARFDDGNMIFPQTTGGLQTASDEATPRIINAITTDIQFISGTINPIIVNRDAWDIPYKNIRKVNQLLKHLPNAPLSEGLKRTYAAEARFLRAWYYSILLKHYGGVPIIGDIVYTALDEIPAVRNTYEECVNYIVSECEAAAEDLSIKPSGRDFGRVGAGACMALKARVLLYAASPLHNGSDFAPTPLNELVGYPSYGQERWKRAADAAQDVIDLQAYSLYMDNDEEPGRGFYKTFASSDFVTKGEPASDGIILIKMESKSQRKERLFQPPSRGGSGGGGYPYQELVDAFGMSNGKSIKDLDSDYDPEKPYENRDPRFYNSIIYDQGLLKTAGGGLEPVDIYIGSFEGFPASQDAVHTGTPTGYYNNKMVHRSGVANYFIDVPQSRPLMRYAEVLLNFAEATNEYEAAPSAQVYEAVELVRERAGLDPYALEPGLSQEEMREIIRNERRVELAFEGFRFWDVRRWMIAEETQNQVMTGMEVIRNGSDVEFNRFDVRKHVFRKAMYFWPIPQREVGKSPEMLQNPYY